MFAQLGNLASKEYVQAPAESQTFTVAITAARLALGGKVLRAKKKRFGVPSHQLVAFQAKYSEYSNGATCCLLLGTAKSQSIPFVLIQIDIFSHEPCEMSMTLVFSFEPNPRILLHLNLSRKQRIVNHGASPWDCYRDNHLGVGCCSAG